MLRQLRRALADTIEAGMGGTGARILAYPPTKLELANGLHVFVQPDPDYLTAWATFTTGGVAEVRYQVVIHVASDDPEAAADLLDDLIDPDSGAVNVFAAILADPTLGLTGVTATPLREPVQAPARVTEGDGSVTFYELILPVHVIAKRS